MVMKFFAKIDSQGRVTIPRNIRTIYDLHDGEYVSLTFHGRATKEDTQTA